MKKHLVIFFGTLFSINCMAQEIPERLEKYLDNAIENFQDYQARPIEQIADDHYDENEMTLFLQFDLTAGLDIIYSKEELTNYKVRLVKEIAGIFDEGKIRAVIDIANSSIMSKSRSGSPARAGRYFLIALEYKLKFIKEKDLYGFCKTL